VKRVGKEDGCKLSQDAPSAYWHVTEEEQTCATAGFVPILRIAVVMAQAIRRELWLFGAAT